LNVVIKNTIDNQKKKCYNCDKKGYFVKDCRQLKKLPWKPILQKNVNIVERSVVIVEQMIFPIDFGNVFILISLNILDIESEEETDINKLEEFNIGV